MKLLKFLKVNLFKMDSARKIAIITPYGTNCGIATYSKYLYEGMNSENNIKVFSEIDNDIKEKEEHVIQCWERGKSIRPLLKELDDFKPDVIYLQHEYGTFNNACHWNTLVGHLSSSWRTVVTLHSIYNHDDKLIHEAPCKEIIVHSLSGRELLKKKGITHCPIHWVPHGCTNRKILNMKFSTVGSKHMLFQYGFGFEYKGWKNAVEIVDKLRNKYSDVVYIGIFNISKHYQELNVKHYESIMANVKARGLEDNFVLHMGYRTDEVIFSYLSQARIGIFPYWNHHEWKVHGSSGAIRLALASGSPVIVGDVPFFEELKSYVPVCSSIDDYVHVIEEIFENPEYEQKIKRNIQKFISERTWDKVGKWYLECESNEDFNPKEEFSPLEYLQ